MKPLTQSIQASISNTESQKASQEIQNLKGNFKSDKQREQVQKAAKNFESFMMGYMFKSMYKSVPKSSFSGSAHVREMFMGLYIDEVSKKDGFGGNGIAQSMLKQYDRYSENAKLTPSKNHKLEDLHASAGIDKQLQTTTHKTNLIPTDASILNDIQNYVQKFGNEISSHFGMRHHPISNTTKFHQGVDIKMTTGTKISSPHAGKVIFAGKKGGYGNFIEIDHGKGITTAYAHLSKIDVKKGDFINENELIGKSGSTGRSTGPHLHFEVKKDGKAINPTQHFSEKNTKGLHDSDDSV